MGKKSHVWLDFFYLFCFFSMIHGDPTCLSKENGKKLKKKKWKKSEEK
jgi:hypothetical protein